MTEEPLSRCVDSTHWVISSENQLHVRADPVQWFRICSSVTHRLFECRAVQFEDVEKLVIETDGPIDIVLNLVGMTERNLVDDLPKMSDTSHLDSSDSVC